MAGNVWYSAVLSAIPLSVEAIGLYGLKVLSFPLLVSEVGCIQLSIPIQNLVLCLLSEDKCSLERDFGFGPIERFRQYLRTP